VKSPGGLEIVSLAPFLSIVGVHQAAIADDAGRLLDWQGGGAPPEVATLVLAHAAASAAAEWGRRSGCGACLEIIQQHESGVLYLRGLPSQRLLLVQCQSEEAIAAIRALCQQVSDALTVPTVSRGSMSAMPDIAAALHAEPTW